MKKVIALSTVLAFGALGMACGDTATNNTAVNANRMNTNMTTVNSNANTTTQTTTTTQVNGATGATNTTVATNVNGTTRPAGNMNSSNR